MVVKRQLVGFIGVFWMAGSLISTGALAQDWTAIPPPDSEVQASFDETLAPYGEWLEADGTRAWRPSANVVGDDFQPYATNGQWLSTDYGWYFQSDYSWGWAPFHYGRWAMDATLGWIWIPGTVWAPAWVDWRMGGGYIGWAPLPPIGWVVVVQPWRPYWCFVPTAHFSGNFWAHRLPVESIHYAYAATAPVHQAVAYGGARWYAGPAVAQVERASVQPVQHVSGSLMPPAPGHIAAIQLQPPRGYSGNVLRNAALRQSAPSAHPPPPPSQAPPSTGTHPQPRGEYTPVAPGVPFSAPARLAASTSGSETSFFHAADVTSWHAVTASSHPNAVAERSGSSAHAGRR